MYQMNFSNGALQQQIVSSNLVNTGESSQVDIIGSKLPIPVYQTQQIKTGNIKSIAEITPLAFHVDGVIVQLRENDLKILKAHQKEYLEKELKLSFDRDYFELIPKENKRVYANSLMNIQAGQVQMDIQQWVNSNLKEYISNNFNSIRYFYFKSTESYLIQKPPPDFGGVIVKYKNQITVLIGIIEQILDQPYVYSNTFLTFLFLYEKYQNSKLFSDEMKNQRQNSEIFKNIIKQLYHSHLTGQQSSFDINQMFFRYINQSEETSNILIKFMKFLFLEEKIEYQPENMEVFKSSLNVIVQSCSERIYQNQDNKKVDELIIFVMFERVIFNSKEFQNCYLLYKKPFYKTYGVFKQEVLPLICDSCRSTDLNSIKYVIERQTANKRYRLCYDCHKKQS